MFDGTEIYWLAVFVAALVSVALGFLWYSSVAFGKAWMKYSGAAEGAKKGMLKSMAGAFIQSFLMSFGMAYFLYWTAALTVSDGLTTAFVLWIAFVATVHLASALWEKRPWKLLAINAGYYLVVLLVQAALLTLMQ